MTVTRDRIIVTGDSLAVTLPKDMLDLFGLGAGDEVSVQVDREQGQIVITPAQGVEEGINADFVRQVDDFIHTYRPELEALAR